MTGNRNNTPLYLAIAIAIGILIGSFLNFKGEATSIFANNSKEAKIKKLIDYIQYEYVDEVDTDDLLDGAITQILGKLDPHSVYIPKEQLQSVTEDMQGNFVGIGVQFIMNNDSIVVARPILGGPSELAGIKAGDRILVADKDTLYGKNLSNNAIMRILKGSPDSDVNLTVYRKSTNEMLRFPIKRGEIDIKSINVSYMVKDQIGYIKIDRFARTTYNEFKEKLDELLKNGMTSLILDLRGNPGGFIDIANSIADEFLEEGKLIVFTKNNKGKVDKSFATSKGSFEKGNLYVLIDESSASASEIIAGALQDNDKGVIVGRRSFGKGLVQQEMDLGDGSAVRLTIARYFTPTGRSIQKPYDHNGSKDYYNDYRERMVNGELLSKDSIKTVDSLQYKTSNGKVVYGGGGIIPDVFVPIDTTSYFTSFHFRILNDFVFKYVDGDRKALEKWSIDTFVDGFKVQDPIFEGYLNKVKDGYPLSKESREILRHYFKAFVARQLFDEIGYYKVEHVRDNMIEKVLEMESAQIK